MKEPGRDFVSESPRHPDQTRTTENNQLEPKRSNPGMIRLQPAKRQTVPKRWRDDVDKILISEAQIQRRVRELAREIEDDFSGSDLVVAALLNGTVLFLADLIRRLIIPLRLDFLGFSSYRGAAAPGKLIVTKELRLDVRGRDVLLVDDILDTGRTLACARSRLQKLKPRKLKTCVLLNKPNRRIASVRADFVGFEIPDLFVIGYGLDYAERYRNLPFLGVLRAERLLSEGQQPAL